MTSITLNGEPTTVEGAEQLAQDDPYQFQWWALGLVGARPTDQKKGADQGIDGRSYFLDGTGQGKTAQIIYSVKAGHVAASQVRDLRGVVDREKAAIGVLLSFEEPTKAMRAEAASGGFYESPWGRFPRLQLLTVSELLEGMNVDRPLITRADQTFQRAERVSKALAEHLELRLGGDSEPPAPQPKKRHRR